MSVTLKILGSEAPCNATPSNFGNARVVRVLETGTGNALITRKTAAAATIGTVTLRQGNELSLIKDPTDTLESNSSTVVAVSVGFTN